MSHRDGIDLRLQGFLNSGEVIAGGFGSGQFGYATVGEQVGMAQRMESVAPPGGVMLSASTARLVEGVASLGELELVRIKGAEARSPSAAGPGRRASRCRRSRIWSAVSGRWPRSRACWTAPSTATVVGVVGSPGIADHLVREVTAIAARGVEVFTAFCKSRRQGHSLPRRGGVARGPHRRARPRRCGRSCGRAGSIP